MARLRIYSIFLICAGLVYQYSCSDHKPVSYDPPEGADYAGENVEITLECGDVLAGTLTIPRDLVKEFPCILLITGSSPHDRDNSKPGNPVTAYRPFRQIADLLSSNGIAVLRMDDRGIGSSRGGNINEMTTPERADDIKQCLRWLKSRTDTDDSRIGLLGLSEGASVAQMIASQDTSVKALILLSAPASKGEEIIKYQIKTGILDQKKLRKLLKKDPNLRYLYGFDPLVSARLVMQPALIINGDSDKNVPPEDALLLKDEMIRNGNPDVTAHILKQHNHLLLQEDSAGQINSTRIQEETLKIILDWILAEL